MWLEPIDPRHPNIAALVRGPLVLMGVKPDLDAAVPVVSRSALLSARRSGATEWRADAASGPITLMPFTALGDRPYTAYLNIA
jgi:hypothetical protein